MKRASKFRSVWVGGDAEDGPLKRRDGRQQKNEVGGVYVGK